MVAPPKGKIEPQIDTALETKLRIRAAKAWRPDEGDMITGRVVKLLLRQSEEFEPYPVVILDTGDHAYTALHAFHQILFAQLKAVKASPGDEFTIVYEGRQISRKVDAKGEPRTYHSYILVANGETADVEFNWDSDDIDELPA